MTIDDTAVRDLGLAIDQVAAAEIASLLEEARVEARAKVRAILVDAIAERLVQLAGEELTGADRPDAAAADVRIGDSAAAARKRSDGYQATGEGLWDSAAPPNGSPTRSASAATAVSQAAGLALYVYGVVEEGAELQPTAGIDGGHDVEVISGEGLAAVVSRVSLEEFGEESLQEHLEDLSWLERNAREHERILDRVREQATLVPMRLCTIYTSARSVREMLSREHAFLRDALDRLERRTEWGVKAYLAANADAPAETADRTPDHQSQTGTDYLRDRRDRDERQRRTEELVERGIARTHALLADLAVEAKQNPLQPSELTNREDSMAFNGVYLVDDGAAEEFASAVSDLGSELAPVGIELELTGPWPPYNFVNSPTAIGR